MRGPVAGPVAAIDCGTNTVKLLVGTQPFTGPDVVRENRMVRLGQGVDATGRLADEALERAFAALDEYAELIRERGVPTENIRFCATSATRDATNAAVFAAGVRERLGVEPEVLSGVEEAGLAFAGAVRDLRVRPAQPVLVVDIGGGSTELILGDASPQVACSLDIGSVRLHERHVRSDPASMQDVQACVRDIDEALESAPVDIAAAASVVGVAGTITTVAAGVLDLPAYDRDAIDQVRLPFDEVHALVGRLVGMTVAERLELPWMHPGRADVIDAGALILSRVLLRASVAELVVSEADILDGIAWSITA